MVRVFLLLTLLAFAGCASPSSTPRPDRPGSAASLSTIVETNAAAGFAGVVLVAKGDRILMLEARGQSGKARVRADSRFWIASAGKQFASAAIMKLVEERRLSLDDPLGKFFPEAAPDKAVITIRQLLSHTSGLGQSYVSEAQTDRGAAVRRMLSEPLKGPPGSGFRYSNSNIQLAAAIVELASGRSYADFARRRLWSPAGLASTGFAGDPGAAAVLPIAGELPPRLRRPYWGEQGVYSSAPDLFRWYRALSKGTVLAPASVRTMFGPIAKIGEGHSALGWFTGLSPTGRALVFIRGNEDFGANSLIYAYPESGVLIIVLSHAGDSREDISWSRKLHGEIEAAMAL